MEFWVYGFGLGVSGLELWVWILGFGIWIWEFGLWVLGLGIRAQAPHTSVWNKGSNHSYIWGQHQNRVP